MDPCWKATSSITDHLKEPPTLSQVSYFNFEKKNIDMNDSIPDKEINGCDVEQSDDNTTNQTTAKVTTNVTLPSITQKVKSGWIKMLGNRVISSSNLVLLDPYQDLIDIDSDFTMTGTIIGIPRNQVSYWTIQWENNSMTMKIQNRSPWSHVMKWTLLSLNVYLMLQEGLIHFIQKVNINKN